MASRDSNYPDVWKISEDEFPKDGPMYEKLKFFLRYAVLAPSIYNTQPWAYRIVNNNTIELYSDRKRILPLADPRGRESTISCGTALGFLQITISHFGYKYKTELLSNYDNVKNEKNLLATISVYNDTRSGHANNDANTLQKEDNNILFKGIPRRRTNRFRFEDRTIPAIMLAGFYYIVDKSPQCQQQMVKQQDRIWFYIAEQINEKIALTELVARGDHILLSDKHLVHELITWRSHNNCHGRMSHVPGHVLRIINFISEKSPRIYKSFKISKRDDRIRELAATSPVLAILGSYSDTPLDWMYTGMALANILLLASFENISCAVLNQPIQVPQLRFELLNVIKKGKGFPQIMLGIGYNRHEIKPTPRRNVEEVLFD
jgi:nitroreductase